MDSQEKEIIAVFDKQVIDDFTMNYIAQSERAEIRTRLANNTSLGVRFTDTENKTLFCAIIDIEPVSRCIHVREVGGLFGRCYECLDSFCHGLMQLFDYKTVSFVTEKRAVKKWAAKMGYSPLDDKEFVKGLQ